MKDWYNGVEMEVDEIVKKAGYEFELHDTITEDGYILQLHRIPPKDDGHGKPVYIQHGLLCSSACWVTSGPKSLGFILHELGFDVWLGNFRGNAYGRRHTSLDPDYDKNFWRFTIHEHGIYDLPAGLKKCLAVTGRKSVSYIGHSMGTTSFLAMCSNNNNNQITDRINVAILLAPVVEPCNMSFPLKLVAPLAAHPLFAKSFESFGIQEFFPDWTVIKKIMTAPWLQSVYAVLLRYKFDPEATAIMKKVSNTFRTGRTSVYTLFHYSQMITKKSFLAYNWSAEEENVTRYQVCQPPKYHLELVKVPTVLFWSEKDAFASVADVVTLRNHLPDLRQVEKVKLCHIDYLWGETADTELYHPIGNVLQKFT